MSTPSTEPPLHPTAPAPPRERLESAVLKFVEQKPETDAEIVSQRVGNNVARRLNGGVDCLEQEWVATE